MASGPDQAHGQFLSGLRHPQREQENDPLSKKKKKKKWNKGSIIILLHLLSDVNVCGVFNIYKLDQKEHGDNVRLTLSCLKP